MKIEYTKPQPHQQCTVHMNEIPVGTVFTAKFWGEPIADAPRVFLRTFEGVVSLTNPMHTWNNVRGSQFIHYQPRGAKIVIED